MEDYSSYENQYKTSICRNDSFTFKCVLFNLVSYVVGMCYTTWFYKLYTESSGVSTLEDGLKENLIPIIANSFEWCKVTMTFTRKQETGRSASKHMNEKGHGTNSDSSTRVE